MPSYAPVRELWLGSTSEASFQIYQGNDSNLLNMYPAEQGRMWGYEVTVVLNQEVRFKFMNHCDEEITFEFMQAGKSSTIKLNANKGGYQTTKTFGIATFNEASEPIILDVKLYIGGRDKGQVTLRIVPLKPRS